MNYPKERNFHSRKLIVHNKSSSNAILSSFIRQKYGDIDYWKMKEDKSNEEKLSKSKENLLPMSKMEIKSRRTEPTFFFPIHEHKNRDRTTFKNGSNEFKKINPSKYVIEIAVFVDLKLYEILSQTFPRDPRKNVSNVILAMIDMVSNAIIY